MKFVEVGEGLGLRLDSVEGRNLAVGDGVFVEPAVVEPGVAIVQFSDQGHGSQVELAAIFSMENGVEVSLVGGIELLLREAGEESADHLIDLRGHHAAVGERDGGRRLGAKE